MGLFIAGSALAISPLAHAATLEDNVARAESSDTSAFANGLMADPADIAEEEESTATPPETGGGIAAIKGKKAHTKVPHALHGNDWKHTGTAGRIHPRKAARYANNPKQKRNAEVSLTREHNKLQFRKGNRKNGDGSYRHQLRLDHQGNIHRFEKR
jgi:hypothetical protein